MNPGSTFLVIWDIIHSLIILILIYFESIKIAFSIDDNTETWSNHSIFKIITLSFLSIDILFHFFTGKLY